MAPLAAEDSLLTPTSILMTPALISSPPCPLSAAYCAKLDAHLSKMGLPPLGASPLTSSSTAIDTLEVFPMSDRDFPPLDQMSLCVTRRLNPAAVSVIPAAQSLYATALRTSPAPVPQSCLSNSKPHAPATPYLHTPACQCAKYNDTANKYWYVKRVEMEWFGHNPNLNGSEFDGEEDAWSAGEWEDRVQAGLDVSEEAS
jgi:hypothetical protein